MKRCPVLFVVFFLVMGLFIASPMAVKAKTINLRVASWMPAKSVDSAIADYWTKMIQERTKGRVKCTVYKASALGFFKDHYDMAIKGISDISFFSFGLNPGRFPISEALHLPFVVPSSAIGGKVFSQLYREFAPLRAEFGETQVLGLGTVDVWNIQSMKKPIKTMKDLKGLKIRVASGAASESVKALGGIPIGLPVPELYLSLQKGVVDGCVMSWEGIRSFKIYELLKYYTDAGGFTCLGQGLFMNKGAWNKLPPDIQKIMGEESFNWWAEEKGKMFHDKWAGESKALVKKRGGQIYNLPPEEKKKWAAALAPVREAWVKRVAAKGVDGEKFLARAEELVKQYQ
ncbi:MAG: TRAP transporter substrate-binding protein [Deltaproteobacteria bacterium]|nr:TRAP transporter substrate-binding protein [Deltaproteobacteria bacterium]